MNLNTEVDSKNVNLSLAVSLTGLTKLGAHCVHNRHDAIEGKMQMAV